jgi:hypothetical protein
MNIMGNKPKFAPVPTDHDPSEQVAAPVAAIRFAIANARWVQSW